MNGFEFDWMWAGLIVYHGTALAFVWWYAMRRIERIERCIVIICKEGIKDKEFSIDRAMDLSKLMEELEEKGIIK